MSATLVLSVLGVYFLLLIAISQLTGKKGDNETFFTGNRNSPWYLVAFGMIGASLSGVTFISIPGAVVSDGFSYMQMVLGYLLGYAVIARFLIPLYYRMNLTSIYGYLNERFGRNSYLTGAGFFLISRIIGASFRLYLVAMVLHAFVFSVWNVPFAATVAITIILIWLYSFKGGIKTIVWTDTLQTTFMLLAVVLAVVFISDQLNWTLGDMVQKVQESDYSKVFVWDWHKGNYFFKHFLSGMFITIVMTGLDQDMMQKNLTCRNEKEARKNIRWMSYALVPVNLLFLALGALLYLYGTQKGLLLTTGIGDFPIQIMNPDTHEMMGIRKDLLFPSLAINFMGPVVGLIFVVGLIAAAYSSADSALTALTTSFCVDFLGFKNDGTRVKQRYLVHIMFSVVLFLVIVVFKQLHNDSLVNTLFSAAGYTYGPLLGLFAFGIFTRRKINDHAVPYIALFSATAVYFINLLLSKYGGFNLGFMVLLVNGGITMLLIWLVPGNSSQSEALDEAIVNQED
ncbi:sodium:solute symporter [bacterium]|nr:sodium:solute symporter [bacterium]